MRLKLSVAVLGLAFAVSMNASQLFTDGGFESGGGSLTGWTTTDSNADGSFFADTTDTTPDTGEPTVGPDTGSAYAVSDGFGPGSYALTQTVTVNADEIDLVLSFDMFVNDWNGSSGPGGEVAIWANGADPLTATPIAIIYTADTTVTGGVPNPYLSESFDIAGDVTAGKKYVIGVVESSSTGLINVGVDDFSLVETRSSSTVPEPGMLFPTALLAAGVLVYRARRKVRAQV